MPIGKGNVLIGMSERTSRQAISQLAAALFAKGAAERVIVAAMPKLRGGDAPRHGLHLRRPRLRAALPGHRRTASTPTPTARAANPSGVELHKDKKPFVDVVAEALGVKKMRVVETGGNAYMRERTQWDSGANLVCASPGVVFAYDRNTYTNTLLRKAGHRGHHDRRRRTRPRPRRRPLHDLPDHPRRGGLIGSMAIAVSPFCCCADWTVRALKY